MVSAPIVAKERGMVVDEIVRAAQSDYESLITVTVTTERQERSVSGTVYADGKPRLVDIKGIRVDAEFGKSMIYITNEDKPGFIGKFAGLLGDARLNIATFHLGRNKPGGDANKADNQNKNRNDNKNDNKNKPVTTQYSPPPPVGGTSTTTQTQTGGDKNKNKNVGGNDNANKNARDADKNKGDNKDDGKNNRRNAPAVTTTNPFSSAQRAGPLISYGSLAPAGLCRCRFRRDKSSHSPRRPRWSARENPSRRYSRRARASRRSARRGSRSIGPVS